ncbi:YrhA family protein [Yersinia artesiana]|uniref:YrhA family protein n=1 Tax=Yersinia artesiana TaxID=2890315 RepID=UPI0015839396|nr:YrhA family protein [Yersinia artesiana]
MGTENQKLITLINKIHDIAQSRIAAGYEDREGISEDQVESCHQALTSLGGNDFAVSYLPFLRNVNGFDLNGVRLFGYFNDKNDERDLRKQLSDLLEVPELFPQAFKDWVMIGETDTDILVFNKKTGLYENRDRIGLDRLNESYKDIADLLTSLMPLIE